jgi:NYN domain
MPPKAGPKTARVLRTEEKGSDVNLASYLLLDAFRGDCETAIVVSNDADLKAPIEIVRGELGVPVGVLNPHPPKRQSRDLRPTFFKQLRRGPIAASQFPPVLSDAHGEIRKPSSLSAERKLSTPGSPRALWAPGPSALRMCALTNHGPCDSLALGVRFRYERMVEPASGARIHGGHGYGSHAKFLGGVGP